MELKVETWPIERLVEYARNPRKNDEQVERMKAAIKEFGFRIPVVAKSDGTLVDGHLRLKAARALGLKEIPVALADELTETQVKAFRLLANQSANWAEWDSDLLKLEIEELEADGFDCEMIGFDEETLEDTGSAFLQVEGEEEGNAEYQAFVDKFKPKLTTDDCYTPPKVYEAVADWVAKEYHLDRSTFVRPFKPGGDYQSEDYAGKVVVDNPPFSIMSQIEDWFTERGIRFFLFAPHLTLFNPRDLCFIVCGADVVYENGAKVNTSFVTNLNEVNRFELRPDLTEAIESAQEGDKNKLPKFELPDEIFTSSRMTPYMELRVPKSACQFTRDLDGLKEIGKSLYGNGFFIAKAEALAKAEAAKSHKIVLSEREREIVEKLG